MKNEKLTPLLIVLLVIASFLAGSFWTKTRHLESEKLVEPTPTPAVEQKPAYQTTVGDFLVMDEEICREDGKPIVYFFGSERCSHCSWEHPIFEAVTAQFADLIAVHNNMDKFEVDQEIWQRYAQINPRGAIPFLVLGCQYARVGSGEGLGEEEEAKVLTSIICQLTEGKPKETCEPAE